MLEILFQSQGSYIVLSKPFLTWNLLFYNLSFPPQVSILRINYCKALYKWKAYINSKWCCYIVGDVPMKYWQKPLVAKACIDVLNSCWRTVPLWSLIHSFLYIHELAIKSNYIVVLCVMPICIEQHGMGALSSNYQRVQLFSSLFKPSIAFETA